MDDFCITSLENIEQLVYAEMQMRSKRRHDTKKKETGATTEDGSTNTTKSFIGKY